MQNFHDNVFHIILVHSLYYFTHDLFSRDFDMGFMEFECLVIM